MHLNINTDFVAIKGNTYYLKDCFKSQFGASWKPDTKEWIIQFNQNKETVISCLQNILAENDYSLNKRKSSDTHIEYSRKRPKVVITCSHCGQEGHRITNCQDRIALSWSRAEWDHYLRKMDSFYSAIHNGEKCLCVKRGWEGWVCQWRNYRRAYNPDYDDCECFCQLSPIPTACSFCEFACCPLAKTKKDAVGCYATECSKHGIRYDTRGT